jgi:hypothetical protein
MGVAELSGGKGARKAAPARMIRDTNISGRGALERPRPGTGGISDDSHADSTYLASGEDLDGFVRWFSDWWLRRGSRLTDPAERSGD